MGHREIEWKLLLEIRHTTEKWLKEHNIEFKWVHADHYVTYLEVYVFFHKDKDVVSFKTLPQAQELIEYIIEYAKKLTGESNITVTFDSHENVVNNYQGNYYWRFL